MDHLGNPNNDQRGDHGDGETGTTGQVIRAQMRVMAAVGQTVVMADAHRGKKGHGNGQQRDDEGQPAQPDPKASVNGKSPSVTPSAMHSTRYSPQFPDGLPASSPVHFLSNTSLGGKASANSPSMPSIKRIYR